MITVGIQFNSVSCEVTETYTRGAILENYSNANPYPYGAYAYLFAYV